MHLLGTHIKVTINRAGGAQDVIHDADLVFANQTYYLKDAQLGSGDTITTQCLYSGFATFGTSSTDENCYFFTLSWPAGSLRSGIGSFIHGPNTCM